MRARYSARPIKALFATVATVAALAVGWAQPALAWGEVGHRTIAAIAQANIKPETAARIADLLKAEAGLGTVACPVKSLADAAVWPDCLRSDSPRWAYTFPWHFHDSEVPGPGFDLKANCSYGGCVTAQIDRTRRIVADKSLPVAQRLEALAFLTHFVGDLHQPLHAAEHEHDHGGNAVKVDYPGNPNGNLHWLWDSTIAERAVVTAPSPVVRAYTSEERAKIATGTVGDWAQESWVVARDVVYPQVYGHAAGKGEQPHGVVTITQAQIDADAPVARGRIVAAGLRLARVLDEALGQ